MKRWHGIFPSVLFVMLLFSACTLPGQTSSKTSTPTSANVVVGNEGGLTYIRTLSQGQVFVAFGHHVVIRKPDNTGSRKVLDQVTDGVLAVGLHPQTTSFRLIVDMSGDVVSSHFGVVNSPAGFAEIYCSGIKIYHNKVITLNVPDVWKKCKI